MKQFLISDNIFKIFGDLHIGVVVCENITNNDSIAAKNLLNSSIEEARKDLSPISNLTDLDVIKKWRDAYKNFNEKKNRSSIESLLRRIYNNKEISSINPLVDIYNSISIKYSLPCGGEDLNTISDDIELTLSDGSESFIPLGSDIVENPNLNEIVYKSNNMVICRCFNWRESEITKLTPDTKNALLCIECLSFDEINTLKTAVEDLSNYIRNILGGKCSNYILNKNNRTIKMTID